MVVYLAVVQGSTSAGQSLSFGPSTIPTNKVDEILIVCIDVAQAFAAANRIRNMRPRDEPTSLLAPLWTDNSKGDEKEPQGIKIELKNVGFRYPTRDIPVLIDLTMTVSVRGRYKLYTLTHPRLKRVNLLPLLVHPVEIISYAYNWSKNAKIIRSRLRKD